jgi:multidrug efflux pump subunit AcrB
MQTVRTILNQRKLILSLAVLTALAGILAAFVMPRQEDARIPDYWGLVITGFPGADVGKVERLVVDPIEEYLAEVEEIRVVESTIRAGVAVTQIELYNTVDDVDDAWDEVRRALEKAEVEFPDGVGKPSLDRKLQDPDSVVLAVTGTSDPVHLSDSAASLKKAFLSLKNVARVNIIADPGKQITIELDDAVARRLGIDPRLLAAQLGARNRPLPGGSLHLGGKTVVLRLNDEFESVEEIATTPIVLPSGAALPVGEPAVVRKGPVEPARSLMRFAGQRAVGLGIVPQKGIDVVQFGEEVRAKLAEVRKDHPDILIEEVTFQPDRVKARLENLGTSLLMSISIVAGVLVLAMGVRLGLIVASVVPLVALSSLAVYAWGGGILHQISIAAFVIALGMLVDNAIVIAENVQYRIDRGDGPFDAAAESVRELAIPLAAATGTTLSAFLPMLLADSVTADFTRSLPVVIMITLSVSYLFAVLVTPILSAMFLARRDGARKSIVARAAAVPAGLAITRGKLVVTAAIVLVAGSLYSFTYVDRVFFPTSDRNQLLIDVTLPEGAHLSETDAAAAKIETGLHERDDVVSYASFVGRNAPQFYYNVPRKPNSPHFAQIVVTTSDVRDVGPVLQWARQFAAEHTPAAQVVARRLEQGPPLDAPVRIRLMGRDLRSLSDAADKVIAAVRDIPEAVDVRDDVGLGVPTIRFRIDDASAARYGLSRSDVALAVMGRTRGMSVGHFWAEEDPIPILVRSSAGERYRPENLASVDVAQPGKKPVPLGQLARSDVEWLPAVIHHRDRVRMAVVSSQVAEGGTYSRIIEAAPGLLAQADLPNDIATELAGAVEDSARANAAMFRELPVALVLLIVILMAEFNSFRRVAIILVTVPLAATGVIPGLLLSGEPFGFQSLLGVFALAGVVVNNAIVLLDRIEIGRAGGYPMDRAVSDAVQARARPILLTTATTVLGLLPLALSSSNLWPPLAWAMISGLIASTALTLLVVPSMYVVLFRAHNAQ